MKILNRILIVMYIVGIILFGMSFSEGSAMTALRIAGIVIIAVAAVLQIVMSILKIRADRKNDGDRNGR